MVISDQQDLLLTCVAGSRSRVSVASGHSCFGKGTSIMLADGSCVPVESVKVGDKLMGADGNSQRNVLSLATGKDKLYRFTYMDNTSHVFNENHILCLIATNSKGRRVAGTKSIVTVKDWLTWGEDKKRCHAIYRSPVKEFSADKPGLPIPPYLMGVWLGDGTSSLGHVTTADIEIKDTVKAFAESVGCDYKEKFNSQNSVVAMVVKRSGNTNPMMTILRDIGVLNNKHIPDIYLYASLEDRLELLAGLIDTDGSLSKHSYDFVQKNELIANQTMWLARSIGCHATIKKVSKKCVNNGVVGTYFRVTIGRNIEKIPVRIERKKLTLINTRNIGLNFGIRSVESLGIGDYYGFELDGDRRFLGGDFTVLHNTGKTFSLGNLVLWHILCHEYSLTFLTANDMDQLKATLWKEIRMGLERIRRGPHGWIAEHLEILADGTMRVRGFETTWFVESKTADEKSANKMAGRHAEWLLVIADEAATIADAVMTTLNGALSETHNRFLMTSQPIKNAGFFWRTHNEISTAQA
ncbi:MAG: Hint domain-containing homing endonuclease [Methylovulum sp.]|nr:Hint domain-containing homing endonuclease [Methylovulum sp.]